MRKPVLHAEKRSKRWRTGWHRGVASIMATRFECSWLFITEYLVGKMRGSLQSLLTETYTTTAAIEGNPKGETIPILQTVVASDAQQNPSDRQQALCLQPSAWFAVRMEEERKQWRWIIQNYSKNQSNLSKIPACLSPSSAENAGLASRHFTDGDGMR